jgi:diadenosine tetraphosphate (Ap4A) HIT family hydrolase
MAGPDAEILYLELLEAIMPCPLCEIPDDQKLARTSSGFLTFATREGRKLPGHYLLVPTRHVPGIRYVAQTWSLEEIVLLRHIFLDVAESEWPSYSYIRDSGPAAGECAPGHLHAHVVIRDPNRPSAGMELAQLVDEYDQLIKDRDQLEQFIVRP